MKRDGDAIFFSQDEADDLFWVVCEWLTKHRKCTRKREDAASKAVMLLGDISENEEVL